MTRRVYVLGPGDDRFYGTPGLDQSIYGGRGADAIITGGGGYKLVNSGMQAGPGETNAVYSESLAGFGNAWVGGHRLLSNGVWDEFHEYHLGAGDESRITIAANRGEKVNGEYQMHVGLSEGVFVIHGPGGATPTRIKSFQAEAQKLVLAADDADDVAVTRADGVVTRDGDHFDFNLKVVRFYDTHDRGENPGDAGQNIQVDFMHLHRSQQVVLEIEENTPSARFEAADRFIHQMEDDGVFLFGG